MSSLKIVITLRFPIFYTAWTCSVNSLNTVTVDRFGLTFIYVSENNLYSSSAFYIRLVINDSISFLKILVNAIKRYVFASL